jgi:hypothetical protein
MGHVVTRSTTRLSFLLAALFLFTASASAQDAGIQAGLSVDPDQFYFGGHVETSALVDRVHFRPNIEVGFGDDLTLITANMDFVYRFLTNRNGWGLYAGGGPALNIFMNDDDSNSEAGVNFLVGVYQTRGLFFEFKVGAMDSPDFKFGVGWTFR